MFTGIVETIGEVRRVAPLGEGRRLSIAAPFAAELAVGDSVAVDGCCLTVVDAESGAFTVEAVRETLARTTIGGWTPGRSVNLERALPADGRLGGHFVLGHVDDVATVRAMERLGENRYIDLTLPPAGLPLAAARGSIAVDGVSLTILETAPEGIRLSIVPHTWSATTFPRLEAGSKVHVEYDVIARYLQRLMEMRS